MRPLAALFLWMVIVGGLGAYMHSREPLRAVAVRESAQAAGTYTLDITTTFDVEPDPFALRPGSADTAAALVVKVNGREALRMEDRLQGGTPIRVEPVVGLAEGKNELFIEANPPVSAASRVQALRVRVYRGDQVVTEHSLWSDAGSRIAATFSVNIEPFASPQEGHRGH